MPNVVMTGQPLESPSPIIITSAGTSLPPSSSSTSFGTKSLTRRQRLYLLLTRPDSSKAARMLSWYFVGLVICSLLVFCISSVPQWSRTASERAVWFSLETIIAVQFVADFFLKVFSSQPTWKSYLFSWHAVIDLLSIIPWAFDLLWSSPFSPLPNISTIPYFGTLRLLRLLRFFRFFRTTVGNLPRITLFLKAVRCSGLAVLFLIIYIFGAGLFFSGCLYFAETGGCVLDHEAGVWLRVDDRMQKCPIQSMFDAMWLCLVTMATVGYGDLVPTTNAGRFVTSIIMITTMIFIPLPISIFGANLTELYLEARLAHKLQKRRTAHHHHPCTTFPPNGSDASDHHHPQAAHIVNSHTNDGRGEHAGNGNGNETGMGMGMGMENVNINEKRDEHGNERKDEFGNEEPNPHHIVHPILPNDNASHHDPQEAYKDNCSAMLSWPPLNVEPQQIMTMRETASLFSMMEALEENADHISKELAHATKRLDTIRHYQRHIEMLIIQQHQAALLNHHNPSSSRIHSATEIFPPQSTEHLQDSSHPQRNLPLPSQS